jgi:hypothetical protein
VYLRGPAGQKVTRTIEVRAEESRLLKLEEGNFDLDNKITYTIEEVEPGRLFRIHFATIPGPPENYKGVLTLKTNFPERPQITIPIIARFKGAGTVKKGGKN